MIFKKLAWFAYFFIFVSCQSLKYITEEEGIGDRWVRKQWVINTLRNQNLFNTSAVQTTPTILSSGLIIQGDSHYGIRAYDRQYGNLQWVFPVDGGMIGNIVDSQERIFFSGSDGFFYSLEKETGRILWKFFTHSEYTSAPFVKGNSVYFTTSKGKVYALDVQTGRTLWIFNQGSSKSDQLSIYGMARPLADDQRVYVGFQDGYFVALGRKTGKWLWRIRLAKNFNQFKDSDAHPVIAGNLIYVSSYGGGIFCLNKKTGKIIWKNKLGTYSSPTIEGRYLYYSTSNNHIVALNRFTGRSSWVRASKGLATQPTIYKSYLIFGVANGGLYMVKKSDGTVINHLNLFRGITTPPLIDSRSRELFVMSAQAWLYKFRLIL